jgi:hypothetical protein
MPPPQSFDGVNNSKIEAPVVHKIYELYKKIYTISSQIPKKDRLGIYAKIENICLQIIDLIFTASLEIKNHKLNPLNSARVKIELLKRLIRISQELNIISSKKYIELEIDLQEISKMTNGWIKYLLKKPQ